MAAVALFLAVVVVLVGALPGLSDVRARFNGADPLWIAATGVLALGSVLSYCVALRATLSNRMPWRAAWSLGIAEQSGNVLLPAGGVSGPALGTLLMRRAGVPPMVASTRSAALFLLTSATSLAALVLFGAATGAGLLHGSPGWLGTLLPAGLAVLALGAVAALGALPTGEKPAGGRRWRLRVHSARVQLVVAVRASLELLREHHPLLIAGLVGYLGFDIAALGAGFEAFGGGGPLLGPFVLAYVLGQAGAIIPTPGGIGGTEGGLVGLLAAYGAPASLALAAVLAYRLFQLAFPVVLGVVAFPRIRRRFRDGPPPGEVAARYASLG